MFTVNKHPTVSDLGKFGWAMLIGFGVIGLVLWLAPWLSAGDSTPLAWPGTRAQTTALCLWALGAALWVLGLTAPRAARPVYIVWMTLAAAVGAVMSTVLLTVLFVLLLPIFSLVVRLGDPLRRKLTADDSYWEDYRPHEATLERMKRPF